MGSEQHLRYSAALLIVSGHLIPRSERSCRRWNVSRLLRVTSVKPQVPALYVSRHDEDLKTYVTYVTVSQEIDISQEELQ